MTPLEVRGRVSYSALLYLFLRRFPSASGRPAPRVPFGLRRDAFMVPHWAVDSQVAAQVSFLPHARKVHQDRSDRHEDGRALGQPAQALLAEVSVHEHRLEGGGQSDTRGRLTLVSRLAVHATAHWCVHDSMGVACDRHGRQRCAAVARRQRCAAVTRNEAGGRGDDEREKQPPLCTAAARPPHGRSRTRAEMAVLLQVLAVVLGRTILELRR